MSDTPQLTDDVRAYLGAQGRRGQRARWATMTPEERRQATEPARTARRGKPTTSQRLTAAEAELEALRAEVANLRQLVAA